MKIQRYIKQLLFLAASLLPAAHLMAQADTIPSSGEWNEITVTASDTILLTGDIRSIGKIKIGDGKDSVTVTIKNGTSDSITITRDESNAKGGIFELSTKSTLVIQGGGKGKEIIFDGGAKFTWEDALALSQDSAMEHYEGEGKDASGYKHRYKLTPAGMECTSSMFATNGNLTLEYVKIHDYYTKDVERSAIRIGAKVSKEVVKCGKTTLRHCTIENCQAPMGSAIHEGNDGKGEDFQKKETDPEKCAVTLEDTRIIHCISTLEREEDDENKYHSQGGGAIRTGGYSTCNLILERCEMVENYSQGDGSCIFWNAGGNGDEDKIPQLTIDECMFKGNGAKRDGGVVVAETKMRFGEKESTFTDNFCGRQGGAILVRAKISGEEFNAMESIFDFGNVDISKNRAGERGGGIAVHFDSASIPKEGYNFEVSLKKGTKIGNNNAGKDGGGISFTNYVEKGKYTFHLYLDEGVVSNNTAKEGFGGGIYVDNSNISYEEANGQVVISNNHAKSGGGGIYLAKGKLDLVTATIQNNSTDGYGGGVYVSTSADAPDSLALHKGEISGNTAGKSGGGIAAEGYVDVTVDGIKIQGNMAARNGGGLFIKGDSASSRYAKMVFESGLVSSNIAKDTVISRTERNYTGYEKSEEQVEGLGGGVYLGRLTNLAFNIEGNNIGIYDNKAGNGADDLFCAGNSNSVTLPNVTNMALSGYGSSKEHSLFWVEDYPKDDPNYGQGTKKDGHWDTARQNTRYRERAGVYKVNFAGNDTTFTDKYLSLTLGWIDIIDMTIEKTGMEERDNAIFKIYQGEEKEPAFMTVILTGNDKVAGGARKKTIKVEEGTWIVKEAPWSWAYGCSPPSITRDLWRETPESERTFKFENTSETGTPKHAESAVTNELVPPPQP